MKKSVRSVQALGLAAAIFAFSLPSVPTAAAEEEETASWMLIGLTEEGHPVCLRNLCIPGFQICCYLA